MPVVLYIAVDPAVPSLMREYARALAERTGAEFRVARVEDVQAEPPPMFYDDFFDELARLPVLTLADPAPVQPPPKYSPPAPRTWPRPQQLQSRVVDRKPARRCQPLPGSL